MAALHVRVRVADEQYAFPVSHVLEVADVGAITPVPGAPAAVLGVRNLRGTVLPVIDLAAALALTSEARPTRVVVVEEGGRQAAFAVSTVLGVDELPQTTEEIHSQGLQRGVLVDGALVGVVDVKLVLDSIQAA